MAWQGDADSSILQVLDTFNHRPTWQQTKAPLASKSVTGHLRTFKADESEYINAYGEQGVEIICKATDFSIPPEKFDRFEVGADVYVVHAVKEQRGFRNNLIVYRCLCRGD